MAKKIMRPKKTKKIAKNEKKIKIEKKPYSEEERVEKLRQDRLTIAKRYEEMRLYDEAISYYKKLGLATDVERVTKTKNEIYFGKAQEFESAGKYEDALRLYENLNLTDEVARIKQIMDSEGIEYDSTPSQLDNEPVISNTAMDNITNTASNEIGSEPTPDQSDISSTNGLSTYQESMEKDKDIDEEIVKPPNKQLEEFNELRDTEPKIKPPKNEPKNKKIFKICPYCGEELNLPKKPNFCPYCKETYV